MNILITGGMGVLGSMVVEELMERDSSVVLYARHQDHSLLPEDIIQRADMFAETYSICRISCIP